MKVLGNRYIRFQINDTISCYVPYTTIISCNNSSADNKTTTTKSVNRNYLLIKFLFPFLKNPLCQMSNSLIFLLKKILLYENFLYFFRR